MSTSVDVTGIIVNYRTAELTVKAARSLLDAGAREVVVIDNDSQDASVQTIAEAFGDEVNIVVSERNDGFGAGANRGAARATSTHLFFLNSDAVIDVPALELLTATLEQGPDVGLVAPLVLLPDGSEQADAFGSFPSIRTIARRTNRRPTPTEEPDWISGLAFAARRDEFLRLGGFDERIHMYFEDVLLCRTYRRAGFRIRRIADARVTHLRGGSWQQDRERRRAYDEAQLRYFRLTGTPRPLVALLQASLWIGARLGLRADAPV